jgi:hypothetical protein
MTKKIYPDKEHKVLATRKWVNRISGNLPDLLEFPSRRANANVWDIDTKVLSGLNQGASTFFYSYSSTPNADLVVQDDRISDTRIPSGFNQVTSMVYYPCGSTLNAGQVILDNPQTQPATLDSKDVQVQELIYRFRKLCSIPYCQRLAERLLSLFNDAKEEDPSSLGIAAGSLHDFYYFLRLHNNLKYPSIFLTPDENIYASWKSGRNRVFSVKFLSNNEVRFVIFKPNKNYPEHTVRFYGTATADTLMDEIFTDSLDWITE